MALQFHIYATRAIYEAVCWLAEEQELFAGVVLLTGCGQEGVKLVLYTSMMTRYVADIYETNCLLISQNKRQELMKRNTHF